MQLSVLHEHHLQVSPTLGQWFKSQLHFHSLCYADLGLSLLGICSLKAWFLGGLYRGLGIPFLQLAALCSFSFTLQSAMDLFLVHLVRKSGVSQFQHFYNCGFITGAHSQGKTVEEKEEIIQGVSLYSLGYKNLFMVFSSQKDEVCIRVLTTDSDVAANSMTLGPSLRQHCKRKNGIPLKVASKFLLLSTICLLLFTFQSASSCLLYFVQRFQL